MQGLVVAELITATRGSDRPAQLYKASLDLASEHPFCQTVLLNKLAGQPRLKGEETDPPSLKCAAHFSFPLPTSERSVTHRRNKAEHLRFCSTSSSGRIGTREEGVMDGPGA